MECQAKEQVDGYLQDAQTIIETLVQIQQGERSIKEAEPAYLRSPLIRGYQRYIFEKFSGIITTPSVAYISKSKDGWLIVGDNRKEIAARISLVIEHYGIGVGMLVLHAQQMYAGYIPLSFEIGGRTVDLTQPTLDVNGGRGERIINVPVRAYRADNEKLAEHNIAKPNNMLNQSNLIRHNGDKWNCRYCSAKEMFPCEVIVNVNGAGLGLSRNYNLGFTYAPFGNPIKVVHFLAWDSSEKPLNMNRTPVTVSDLVILTRKINISLVNFFAGTGITDYPVIDGVSNGWAGNSIYHQHFQFFAPEFDMPIRSENLINRQAILSREDVRIHRLSWNLPIYKITADESINVGLVGNDLAGIWRLMSNVQILHPGDTSYDGFQVEEPTEMRFHTQNLYVPGDKAGKEAFILLRDRRLIDFDPKDVHIDKARKVMAQAKKNIGVLEASGIMIADDPKSFAEASTWNPAEVSAQIDKMVEAVCSNSKKIAEFEKGISGLFPPE